MNLSSLRHRLLRPALTLLVGLSLVASLTTGAVATLAQGTPAAIETPSTITVTGVGTVSVTPDVAHVTVGVTINNASLSEAQQEANTTAQAVIDIATGNDIAEADIQTDAYSVNVIEDYDDNGNLTGRRSFTVSNILTMTIRDLDSVGGILDQMVDAGANTIYGISFDVSDPGPAVAEARTAAAVDARARADAYAAGLDVEITGIASISEQSAPMPVARYDSASDVELAAASAAVPVAAGSTDLSVTIQVVFLIAD